MAKNSTSIKYLYVYNRLLADIKSGLYRDNRKLPSENELIEQTGLSRQTIRNALKKLQADGYVTSSRGSGYYVNSVKRPNFRKIAHISIRISDYIFPKVLHGIEEVITANGYALSLMSTGNSVWQERQILSRLQDEEIDGLIVSGTKSALPNPNLPLYEHLASQGLPIVFVNSFYPELSNENTVHVVMDDFAGGYYLAEQLFARGLSHIGGFIKADDIQGVQRYNGFMHACIDHGVPFHESDFFCFSSEQMIDQVDFPHILPRLGECDGIFCYNDEALFHLCRFVEHHPLPKLRFVCSFDNMYTAQIPGAGILSLGHAGEELGRIAAEKMINMLAGRHEESLSIPWKIPADNK